jgi:hypothetical protein
MTQPVWDTPAGNLGTYVSNEELFIQVEAHAVLPATSVTYQFLGGNFPAGTISINESGLILGIPSLVTTNTTSTFTIRAIDDQKNIRDRTFSVTITGIAVPKFTIPGGTIGTVTDSLWLEIPVTVNNPDPTNSVNIALISGLLPPGLALNDEGVILGYPRPPYTLSGLPTTTTYEFTLELTSPNGGDIQTYSITVKNQRLNNPQFTRKPVILNQRPLQDDPAMFQQYMSYYTPTTDLGTIKSGEYFAFKVIGYDFEGSTLQYVFNDLPPGLTGNTTTGWITGIPDLIEDQMVTEFEFYTNVSKATNLQIASPFSFYQIRVAKNIDPTITWITSPTIGTMNNGQPCIFDIKATCQANLAYRVVSGTLPPNLTLLPTGQINGRVALQPGTEIIAPGTTTAFKFTVEAYSTGFYGLIADTREFTINVYQAFDAVYENVYLQAFPTFEDRALLDTLLTSEAIIPSESVYRLNDPNFGKASNITFVQAFGVKSSSLAQYYSSININHYWRDVTLGEIKTAVARNDAGEIVYEVVYSSIIDNLINPNGVSVHKEVKLPFNATLSLNDATASEGDIYTSYVFEQDGKPTYYTSLTPGSTRTIYPNSLPNMREQITDVLGNDFKDTMMPLWMTCQQLDGNTLGYTAAWVICYTLPGKSAEIKANIDAYLPKKLNTIQFTLDRYTVDKSMTYNYNTLLAIPVWQDLPSATPKPEPLNAEDYFILFPRKTILPNKA